MLIKRFSSSRRTHSQQLTIDTRVASIRPETAKRVELNRKKARCATEIIETLILA